MDGCPEQDLVNSILQHEKAATFILQPPFRAVVKFFSANRLFILVDLGFDIFLHIKIPIKL